GDDCSAFLSCAPIIRPGSRLAVSNVDPADGVILAFYDLRAFDDPVDAAFYGPGLVPGLARTRRAGAGDEARPPFLVRRHVRFDRWPERPDALFVWVADYPGAGVC